MPKMTEPELITALRANTEIKSPPKFILITGGVNLDLKGSSKDLKGKIDGFIYKPFNKKAILEVIQSVLKKKKKIIQHNAN